MTTPSEEFNAILSATHFLYDLMDPKKTPRVPKWIRVEARRRVKHMPLVATLKQRYKGLLPPPSLAARHYPDPDDAPIL
jgi:hypothetical protein